MNGIDGVLVNNYLTRIQQNGKINFCLSQWQFLFPLLRKCILLQNISKKMLPRSPHDMYDDYLLPDINGHYYSSYHTTAGMDQYIGQQNHDDGSRLYSDFDNVFTSSDYYRYQEHNNGQMTVQIKEEHIEDNTSTSHPNYSDGYGPDLRHELLVSDLPNNNNNRMLLEEVDDIKEEILGQSYSVPQQIPSRGGASMCRSVSSSPDFSGKRKQPRRKNNKDVELARNNNIPATPTQIAEFSYEQLKSFIAKYEFSDEQISLIKAIRRRGRNKKSVALYRQKKGSQMKF
uniref:BZIP domain-containing protein n=1 Tax=Strongyloides stercoralis TaxID=6248 RepID=A0A0K0EDE2_STRER